VRQVQEISEYFAGTKMHSQIVYMYPFITHKHIFICCIVKHINDTQPLKAKWWQVTFLSSVSEKIAFIVVIQRHLMHQTYNLKRSNQRRHERKNLKNKFEIRKKEEDVANGS